MKTLLLLALTATLAAGRPAATQTPAVGFTPDAYGVEDNAADTLGSAAGSYSLGFEFTADAPQRVTSLGFFHDPSFDPANPFNTVSLSPTPAGSYTYAGDHPVGLYQIIGNAPTLLTSATVTSASTRVGDFLYQSLTTPVLLVTGGDYVLAGVTGPTDPYVFNIEDDSRTPSGVGLMTRRITYVQDRFDTSCTLTLPTGTDAGSEPGFLGPNFLASPVPEASPALSLGLLLTLGAAVFTGRRFTRRVSRG